MNKNKHLVGKVLPGSIAEELEIEPGDELLSVNGQAIEDIFDYHYQMNEEYVEIVICKPDGEEWQLEIEKEYEDDIGIEFLNPLMDEYRSCSNKCVFCFIDQMPPNMRETLYFKDDDSRLSFLQGNYVTLTNMSDHDIGRIIQYHLSPINISFHTTNPELRCKMLHNRFAGDIFPKVDRLYEAGIQMNGQIVLCKDINDGAELERTIGDLKKYLPCLESVSVVPIGMTKYRDGLCQIEPFTRDDAKRTLEIIRKWQKQIYAESGRHFIHASDEWYILAGEELPEETEYDGYPQLENGVGMLRLLETEVKDALKNRAGDHRKRMVSIATGRLAFPFIRSYTGMIQEKYPDIKVQVYEINNDFFGERITVSGLITGQDLIHQLEGKELGECLLLPCNMLRSGEDVFLDDVTVSELEEKLRTTAAIVEADGESLVNSVLGDDPQHTKKRRQNYEQADSSYCREA